MWKVVEDESSCHWKTELKWSREAEVSDGTVEDKVAKKRREESAETTVVELKKKRAGGKN